MKKVIKITESELVNVIKKVMNEKIENPGSYLGRKTREAISNRWKKMGGRPLKDIVADPSGKGTQNVSATTPQVKGDFQQKPQYRQVSTFPFPQYSKNDDYIKPLQQALGLKDDGYFGPKTSKAIAALGYNITGGLTQDIFNDIMKKHRERLNPTSINKIDTSATKPVTPTTSLDTTSLATRR